MSNIDIHLKIDRHRSGNSRIHGRVGANQHDVNVWKGPQPGDAYIEGNQNGQPTTLRINGAFSDNGQAIFGRVAGVPFKGNWAQQESDGDARLDLNKANLTIDNDPAAKTTESKGTGVKASGKVVNAEGDEELTLLADGRRINLTVDRQPGGNIELRGRSGDGNFRLTMRRHGRDGDLQVDGSLPENLGLLPVMWELYGDDSVEPPAKPLSMGAAATLSAFWDQHLG